MQNATWSLLLLYVVCAGRALGAEPLDDAALDAVTAGTATQTEQQKKEIAFKAARTTASGRRVSAEGSLLVDSAVPGTDTSVLLLSDSAQGNLRSLVNINAVNSPVNVLLNLNINVHSTVGEIRQINLNSGH